MPVSSAALVRRHLALPVAASQHRGALARRSLRVTALLAMLIAPITSSALPRFQQGWLPGLGSFGVGDVNSTPSLVDVDGDGDLDIMAGDHVGELRLFRNIGSSSAPRFAGETGSGNPFDGLDVGYGSSVAFGDLDGDGDLDAAIGAYCPPRYFANIGSATAPSYVELIGTDNPFSDIPCGPFLALEDLDADGDLDAVLPWANGFLYLRNTGSALAAEFVVVTGSASPLPPLVLEVFSALALGDLDGDGDLDGFFGSQTGTLRYLRNTGSAKVPRYLEVSGAANPGAFYSVRRDAFPTLGDLDGDHDLDLVVGGPDGELRYLLNSGSSAAPAFVEPSGTANPLFGVDIASGAAAPTTGDLDGDGDLDAVVGMGGGALATFLNTGSATSPVYVLSTGSADPFAGINVGNSSIPVLADVDGDGDLDAVIKGSGRLLFFRNTGGSSAPAFTQITGTANPFGGIFDDFLTPSPKLADLDGDGDLDVVVGGYSYYGSWLLYWENTGSLSAAAYVERTDSRNPFNGVVTLHGTPALGDLDGDGDLDLVTSWELAGRYSVWRTYENTGSATTPAFVWRSGSANPFEGFTGYYGLYPTLADLDGDGDLDMLAGQGQGTLTFFESQRAIFSDGFESGDSSAWMVTWP